MARTLLTLGFVALLGGLVGLVRGRATRFIPNRKTALWVSAASLLVIVLASAFGGAKAPEGSQPSPVANAPGASTSAPAQPQTQAPTPAPKQEPAKIAFDGQINPTLASARDRTKVVIKFKTKNSSEKDIENFRVVFQNKKLFTDGLVVVNTIPAAQHSAQWAGYVFEWGKLAAGQELTYNIIAYPKTAGSYQSEVYPKDGGVWLKGQNGQEITLVAKMAVVP